MSSKQPRVLPGRPDGGEWTERERREAAIAALDAPDVTAAPGLIQLTAATRRVVDAVVAAGGRPLIVGGSVRDALLARRNGTVIESKDIDIEVHGLTAHEQLINALTPLGHVDERGVSFGVVAATIDGEDFDLSLPRRNSKTGDGHTGFAVEVDPTMGLRDAAARRDVTINAMHWDPATEELIDCFDGTDQGAAARSLNDVNPMDQSHRPSQGTFRHTHSMRGAGSRLRSTRRPPGQGARPAWPDGRRTTECSRRRNTTSGGFEFLAGRVGQSGPQVWAALAL
jgi:hypothetical protein